MDERPERTSRGRRGQALLAAVTVVSVLSVVVAARPSATPPPAAPTTHLAADGSWRDDAGASIQRGKQGRPRPPSARPPQDEPPDEQGPAAGRGAQAPPGGTGARTARMLPPEAHRAGPVASLHGEVQGVADQRLLDLAGSQAGFAALWSDARHGTPCAYVRRFQGRGTPLALERAVRERYSPAPELEARLALGSAGHAAIAWELERDPLGKNTFQTRALEPDGRFDHPTQVVSSKQGWVVSKDKGRGRDDEDDGRPGDGPLGPRVAVDARGQATLAWTYHGHVLLQRPGGQLARVDPEGPPATGDLCLLPGAGGPRLAAWTTTEGVRAALFRADRAEPVACGPGAVLGLAADPRDVERTWLLVELEGRAVLRPLDGAGRIAGEDRPLFEEPVGRLELVGWQGGLACLRLGGGARGSGMLVLHLMRTPEPMDSGSSGAPEAIGRPLVVPSTGRGADVLEARLAAAGTRLLVAWSERRGTGAEVRGRILEAGAEELGPEFPLASACATSDQDRPAAAGIGGERAVVVWEDRSAGAPGLRTRLVSAAGELLGEPLAVPAGEVPAPAPAVDPQVSMGPAGDFLVTWVAEGRLESQAFHPDATPKRPPAVVAERLEPARGRALARQERYRSWVSVWSEGSGLLLRRVRGDGEPLAEPVSVGGAASAARPAVLELFGERVVVAWEEPAEGETTLRLRLLEPELQAATEVLTPPLPPRGAHREPQLARAADGGFLLAWRVELDARSSRPAALRFDAAGQALGTPIPLGSGEGAARTLSVARIEGGAWALAWELETALGPRAVLCRLGALAEGPGPEHLLDPATLGYRTGGTRPVLAPVQGGLLGFWVDAHRGTGLDVWCRRLPPDFDRP